MIKIREAAKSDNAGLLQLTSLTPMHGQISIRIDRHPDFFRLLELRGPSKVFVAEDQGRIIASISAASVLVYINGKPGRVHYLGDLKVHPTYQRTGLAARMAKTMFGHLLSVEAEYLFCTAAFGNESVMPFFDGKIGLPHFERMGLFRVLQIIPTPYRRKSRKYNIQYESASQDLYPLYNTFFKKYQFGPMLSLGSLHDTKHVVARYQDAIVAAISLVDTTEAKQNVLISLPVYLKVLVSLIRTVHRIAPVLNLPKINEPIRILYIRAYAYEEASPDAFRFLLQKARNIAYAEGYTFLAVGIHEKDPVRKLFLKCPKFTFKSLGMVTCLKNREGETRNLSQRIPFEDYSLV